MRGGGVTAAVCIALLACAGAAEAQPRRAKSYETGAHGPAIAPAAAKRVSILKPGPHFDHLTTTDGLPQSNVTAIAQDRVGFMWFGTQEGLARYDGTRFKVFQHRVDGPSVLPSSYVTGLALDARGMLWIGTERGLAVYDVNRDKFEILSQSHEDRGKSTEVSVAALHADERAVWVGYQDGIIDRFDVDSRSPTRIDIGIGAPIKALASGQDGRIWVGTLGKGLLSLSAAGALVSQHRHSAQEPDGLPADTVNALLVSRDGTLWVGTEDPSGTEGGGGLARSTGDGRYQSLGKGDGSQQLTDPRITFLVEDRAGLLWVGSKNGLTRFEPKTGHTERFEADRTDPGNLSFSWLTSAHADRDGVIWIGTFASGVDKLDPTTSEFEFVNVFDTPTAFCEADENVLWIGTIPGALIRFDRRTNQAEIRNQLRAAGGGIIDLEPHWVTDIRIDRTGKLWMAVLGLGLVAFDPATEEAELYGAGADELGSEGAWRIAPAADGNLWIASWGGGLIKFDPGRRTFVRYTSDTGTMPTDFLYTVEIDDRDPSVLWIGTAKAGLVRFDAASEKAEVFRSVRDQPDSISNNDVLSIDQSRDGSLWIGTYGGGLNRFDPTTRKFKRLSNSIGLNNDTIYGVLTDGNGVLWLATNGGGLVRFDPATQHAVTFDARDGLPDEYAQGGFHRGPSGRFYFGSALGIAVWFRPERVQLDTTAPEALLTGVQLYNEEMVLGRPIWFAPPIELGYRDTLLTFRLAGLAFASPKKIRYQYQLDQGDWIDLAGSVLTLNIPTSGEYVLRVRAANRHGVWGRPSAPVSIHVATPLWRTWWAYAVYATLTVLLVLSGFRFQHRRVARIEQSIRYSAMKRDLELTAAVQTGFLPRESRIVTDDLTVKGFYRPASTCSGDWWWYEMGDDGQHLILVGDVTGHGAGPAMVTAAVASAFRVQRELGENLLARRLQAVNQEVLRVANGEYQMALTAVSIHATGLLTAYGAGGVPPIVITDGGRPEVVVCRGTPLGTADFTLGEARRQLPPSARIFVTTDGVIECEMTKGRRFGLRRLIKLLENTSSLDVDEAVSAVSHDVAAANEAALQLDDWTFMVADWRAQQWQYRQHLNLDAVSPVTGMIA